ncbi:zinc finger protein 571 [Eurytemora carolleeae]|uniref:zinc finger protein 571 n=1 Tax=Eurytemora carolleeae TaxID=1294199 RepID=UPI000C789099|nr:zinc finger protein 571 [Eurytemora carolleeae]|eukprot:XP_023344732.1 zinc finger protein 571-like [Eurytemora affinis]
MLNLGKSWRAFNNFEKYEFNPEIEDFNQFIDSWNSRLKDLLTAGLEYTDHILVFKLLNSSKMSAEAQWRVISTLQRRYRGDCNIVHMTLHLISKEIQIVNQTQVGAEGFMGETEFLKVEIFEEEFDQRENCKQPKILEKDDGLHLNPGLQPKQGLQADSGNPETDELALAVARHITVETIEEENHDTGEDHKQGTTKESITCPICGELRFSDHGIIQHMKIHEQLFPCTICDRSFEVYTDMIKHMKIHEDKTFSCIVCHKTFKGKLNLKQHMKIHGEKQCTCHICGKSFALKSTVDKHMRTHTGEKPFSCKICNKSFAFSDTVTKHMRNHNGEKPYVCKFCQKPFSTSSHMHVHIRRIHIGEKLLECPTCGKKFRGTSNLSKHKRIHTGLKPFKCMLCEDSFTQSFNLKRHLKTHVKVINLCQWFSLFHKTQKIMVNFFVMKFCMINYFRKMLNLCGGWRAFNNFESYEFNSKIEDFNQFIDSWNRRLEDLLDAGLEYTDHILVFKLLNSSKMSAEAQWRVISTLQRRYRGDCNIVHMTLHLISKEIQIVNQSQVGAGTDTVEGFLEETEFLKFEIVEEELDQRENCKPPKILENEDGLHSSPVIQQEYGFKTVQGLNVDPGLQDDLVIQSNHRFKTEQGLQSDTGLQVDPGFQAAQCIPETDELALAVAHHITVGTIEEENHETGEDHEQGASKESRTCPICGELRFSDRGITRHMKTHEKLFPCTICDESFEVYTDMKKHMKVHEDKTFSCIVCQKTFKDMGNLKGHMKIHGEKQCTCHICGKRFALQSAVNSHMRTHTGEKPFSCKICNKSFAFSDTVTKHMRIHTGEKPYVCKFCQKPFSQSSQMHKHIRRIHVGEKLLECPTCGKKFRGTDDLNMHKRIHTGLKPFKCMFCEDSFNRSFNLKRLENSCKSDNVRNKLLFCYLNFSC